MVPWGRLSVGRAHRARLRAWSRSEAQMAALCGCAGPEGVMAGADWESRREGVYSDRARGRRPAEAVECVFDGLVSPSGER